MSACKGIRGWAFGHHWKRDEGRDWWFCRHCGAPLPIPSQGTSA